VFQDRILGMIMIEIILIKIISGEVVEAIQSKRVIIGLVDAV
jgi:hypothetical protein